MTSQTEPVVFVEHKDEATFTDSNVHKNRQVTSTQSSTPMLSPNPLEEALRTIPAEDWCRTWATGGTIKSLLSEYPKIV
jgi:hypothetical protein